MSAKPRSRQPAKQRPKVQPGQQRAGTAAAAAPALAAPLVAAPVFAALGDETRLSLMVKLAAGQPRSISQLTRGSRLTRQAVTKHLRLLEDAGLVVTRRSGREKLHFLNPVPIRLIHDRWIGKYTERFVSALVDLKTELEGPR